VILQKKRRNFENHSGVPVCCLCFSDAAKFIFDETVYIAKLRSLDVYFTVFDGNIFFLFLDTLTWKQGF